jgi:hypothetical protein
MDLVSLPARITIDFREAVRPSRAWILGLADAPTARVDLLAFSAPLAPAGAMSATLPATWPGEPSSAWFAECCCPDFCERDHANE